MVVNSYIKHILLFFIIFCSSVLTLQAKDKRIQLADSVQNLLNNKHIPDSLRVIHLNELALMEYYLEMDESQANQYLSKAQEITNKLENQDLQVFIYTTKIQMVSEPDEIKQITDSCIFYIDRAQNPMVRSIGWQALGLVKRNTPLAFEYIEKALHEIEGKGYWLQEQSVYFDLIHNSYAAAETYPQAIEYAKLSLAAAEKSGNNYIITKSWAEIGIAYLMNYSLHLESDSLANEAYPYFIHALELYKNGTLDISVRSNQLLYNTILINLANIELIRGNIPKQIQYLQEALDIALRYDKSDEIDYNMKPYIYYSAKPNILQCYTNLSTAYKSLKRYKEAEKCLLDAFDFFPKTHLDDIRNGRFQVHRILISLGDLYYETGKYEDAAEFYTKGFEQYSNYYKYTIEGTAQHLDKAYEKKRIEQEFTILQKSLSQKQKNIYLFIIFIVFLIVLFIILYFLQKYRLKNSQQQRILYDKEKRILEALKSKEETEVRLNAYGTEKYKKELLTENLLAEHKDKIIEDLRIFLTNNPSLSKYKEELEQILETNNLTENETGDFNTSFQGLSHKLYKQLQDYADNKLTSLDLKYCHMILMKMSSKEMAEILHVDTSTIRVNKHRLKQKLKLKKEEDLNSFIERIDKSDIEQF